MSERGKWQPNTKFPPSGTLVYVRGNFVASMGIRARVWPCTMIGKEPIPWCPPPWHCDLLSWDAWREWDWPEPDSKGGTQ